MVESWLISAGKKYLKKPLKPNQANNQIESFIYQFNLLNIDELTISKLLELTSKYKVIGQKIHDTTIVASMLSNNIKNIITFNEYDFKTFQEINIFTPDKILTHN